MRRKSSSRIYADIPPLLLATLALPALPTGSAIADDFLGLYVGGAVGQSELRATINSFNCGRLLTNCSSGIPSVSFARHTTGWEAFVGIRPLSFLGAEAEYIDFGSSGTTNVFMNIDRTTNVPGIAGSGTTHPTATALFAVGYLPVPLPYLDVYGKAGVAELRSNINFSGLLGVCAGPPVCDPIGSLQSSVKSTQARPAYGAGLQVKLGSFALRTEYERVSANTGDPALLSLGVSGMF